MVFRKERNSEIYWDYDSVDELGVWRVDLLVGLLEFAEAALLVVAMVTLLDEVLVVQLAEKLVVVSDA